MVTSRFNATDLSKLLKKPNACVFLRKCKRHLALTPKALNNINDSVLVHLNRLVRKFDPELDAVVLGCRNVSVLTNLGTIVDDSPHVHIDIEAEFYLFKPEKDSLLSGVVNKKSRDNIGCLVHDIFNVSIPIDPDEGIDIDNISIGQTLTFCVVVVDFSHPIPFIKGKLIDSRVRSPGKQASGGKKRKRSDQLEVCKKIKSEIDSPLSAEDNINTFTPPSKFPTSILKKTTPFGVESSPARRISFFGDVPEVPTDETNTTEGKTKKKKKKERETSLLEGSPSRQKKKKTLASFENEPETEVGIQDSRQIDSDSAGNKKVKKKKSEQTEQVNDFADDAEQDFNILQDFKVHSKKTKNKAVFENSYKLQEADEISKEINDLSASHLKTKKKKNKHEISEGTFNASNILEKIKKQGSRDENETWITEENYQDQEQINESPTKKKSKKNNKMVVNKQEKASYVTGKGEHSEEKPQGSPHKRKKRISEAEGELKITEINVADIINKTVEDAMKIKKNKEKGLSEVDVQQNKSSVSSPKKQKPNLTNEIEPRKKTLRKDKKNPLQTLSSIPELSATEGQQPQENILQAVQLTPVNKKKKSKKISKEHVEVSDSRVHEYFGEKNKSSSENRKIKRIINSSTIPGSNRVQENQYSGDGDNSFESLSPIKKSDDDDDDDGENEEEPSGFITSTQIEGSKAKKMVSNAKSFDNDLNEVSVRNSFSDSDSFDVEEFSLSYVPQNVKQKKESKDHIASPISSQERKSQISRDSKEASISTKVPPKPGKSSDIDVSNNSMLIPSLSLFTSKQNTTVENMNQKSHSKSSGADSSSSDSESHFHEQHNTLQESRIKSTEVSSPKSMVSKGVQTDEESDSIKNNEHATGKEKKIHSSDKQRKVQSRTLTTTKHMGNESNDADSTDSDLPTFLQKPTKLSSVAIKSGNLPHEPVVSSSNVHKKGTRKSKTTDGGPLNIGTVSNLIPQTQVPKSPTKKNVFGKPKSKGIGSDTSHSDSSLFVGPKTTTLNQVRVSRKKRDPVSSGVESNVSLSKIAKPATQKQFPVSYQEHHSDSSSTDSDLPLTTAAKTTGKQVLISHKKRKPDSSSSDSDLPLAMDVALSKADKPATKKQFPISFQEHDPHSSNSDSDAPSSKHLPPSKAAKTTAQKQVPVSHKKQASVSSSVVSNLPLPKVAKPATKKQFPVSFQEHDSGSSSSDSAVPSSKHLSPSKTAKITALKQVPVSHKKQASVSSSVVSNLPLSKVAKPATKKQFPVSFQEHDSDSSSSDSDVPSSKHLPPSKAAKTIAQKQVPVSHKKQASISRSVDPNLPLSRPAKPATQKQVPVSYQEHYSDSSSTDSDLPLTKPAKTTTEKQVLISRKKHRSDSSSSDSDLPLKMNVPLSKVAKTTTTTTQKQDPNSSSSDSDLPSSKNLPPSKAAKTTQKQLVSHKKHGSESSSSDSDLPLARDITISKAPNAITEKQFPDSHKKHDSDSSSSDSDVHSSKAARITTQKQVPDSHEKHDLGSSGSDSDLSLSMNLPLSKAAKMTTQKQFPVSHKSDSSSDSDLPLSMDLPLSKAAKIMTQKQSSVSNKKSGLHSSNSVSNSSSHVKAKIPSVVKQEPLSPHKSFSSVVKKNSGREMISQADTKISIPKKKDTNASKHAKQESGSNEKKSSGSETNSIVKGLLAKVKTEILTPPVKNSKTGKVEESKKASKEKHGANSRVHTNERKGKKTNHSKETVDSSKHSRESDVNSEEKHEVEETSEGLENLFDELLKNMVLRKEKKK